MGMGRDMSCAAVVVGHFVEHLLGSKEMVGWPVGKSRGIECRL